MPRPGEERAEAERLPLRLRPEWSDGRSPMLTGVEGSARRGVEEAYLAGLDDFLRCAFARLLPLEDDDEEEDVVGEDDDVKVRRPRADLRFPSLGSRRR